MRVARYLCHVVVCYLIVAAVAWAQSTPNFIDGVVYTAAQWRSFFMGKQDSLGYSPVSKTGDVMTGPLRFAMPAPTISSCGGGSPSVVGNRQVGTVTMGTTATTCTLTWDTAYPATPSCRVTWRASQTTMGYAPSPTGLVITQSSASSNVVDYECTGLQ